MSYPLNNFFVVIERRMKGRRDFWVNNANKLFEKLGLSHRLVPLPNSTIDMNTLEQRINFFHLVSSVVENNIEGELIELGCFTGQCATLFQKTLAVHASEKELHLYDSFEVKFTIENNIEDELISNFKKEGLKLPFIHKGPFNETLPSQLPEKIAFAHIDCGFGGDKTEHKNSVLFCLQHIYPRLTPGAICALMDYYDPSIIDESQAANPGVTMAGQEFFADKPEKIISLYGNQSHHAYFKKL